MLLFDVAPLVLRKARSEKAPRREANERRPRVGARPARGASDRLSERESDGPPKREAPPAARLSPGE